MIMTDHEGTRRAPARLIRAILPLILVLCTSLTARSATFLPLYSFNPTNPPAQNLVGASPSLLVKGPDGNFYGTTPHGGTNGGIGAIFKLTQDGTVTPVYNFGHPADGSQPMAPLTLGTNGNFYGVTVIGGTNGWGSIFMITPSGVLTKLYSFTTLNTNNNENPDGVNPYNALVQASNGNFYGTTSYGGTNGQGTVFQISPSGAFTTLYSFTKMNSTFINADGAFPSSLVQGNDGNLYGTAQYGGASGLGTVFKITAAGVLTTLHSFTGQADGSYPSAGLVVGNDSNLYGTTYSGGTNGGGTVFMITPAGALSNLWSFNGNDGQAPLSPLTLGTDGSFYGATSGGGTNGIGGGGTLFSIAKGSNLQVLYSFDKTNGTGVNLDGAFAKGLVQSANGNFYGSCSSGGQFDGGTAFLFSFQNSPVITQQPAGGTNSVSTTAILNVVANGGGLNYQWFKNGLPVADAGNVSGSRAASLNLSSVSSNDIASYSVVVSNTIGSVTSSVAVLHIVSTPLFVTQPTNANAIGGTQVTLSSSAVGPGTLSYQWQFDGAPLSDTPQISGSSSALLSLSAVSAASIGSYTVVVSNSFGSLTSAVAVLNVGVAPSIPAKGQPAPQIHKTVLSQANFYVSASGTPPLTYQWSRNGVILSNVNDISGVNTTNLLVSPVTVADKGTYSVVVANAFGSVTSAAVPLEVDAPTPSVTILSPTPNSRTTLGVLTGTASDKVGIVQVAYYITNRSTGASMTNYAALSAGGTSRTWFTTNTITPGSNTIQVVSLNTSSNYSPLVTENFFYAAQGPFSVTTAGSGGGTVSGLALIRGDSPPGTNSTTLVIGDPYTITAKPDSQSVFLNWTGNSITPTTSPTLTFIMTSNMTLQANFVPNFYLTSGGTYNGLFFDTNHINSSEVGMLANLIVGNQGGYSATLRFAGASYAFSGMFDGAGHAAKTLPISSRLGGPLLVQMDLQATTPPIVTGSVTGTNNNVAWTAGLTAVRAVNTPASAAYTMLLSPGVYAGSLGYGYATITNHNGVVTLNGALADSTTFSQTIPMSASGDVPFFANPTSQGVTGVAFGWLNFAAGAPTASSMTWIRQGLSLGNIAVESSFWTNPPANTPAVNIATASLIVTNPAAGLDFELTVTPKNLLSKLSNSVPNSLSGSINPKTGFLTVTFGSGIGASTITGFGAMLQNNSSGAGFFLTRSNYGGLLLQPTSFNSPADVKH
jgi:uncharacterized repeat protein (TIGR03803 family)